VTRKLRDWSAPDFALREIVAALQETKNATMATSGLLAAATRR
jgi:hypothetical protein